MPQKLKYTQPAKLSIYLSWDKRAYKTNSYLVQVEIVFQTEGSLTCDVLFQVSSDIHVVNKPYILRDICALNSVQTAPFNLYALPVLGV